MGYNKFGIAIFDTIRCCCFISEGLQRRGNAASMKFAKAGQSPSILLVEDNPAHAELIFRSFENYRTDQYLRQKLGKKERLTTMRF